MSKALDAYSQFLLALSRYEAYILNRFSRGIECKKGCDSCCILQTVFPVEASVVFAAVSKLSVANKRTVIKNLTKNNRKRCVYLDDLGSCMIYDARPVICRTHGYPLLSSLGEMIVCEKNMKKKRVISSEGLLTLEAVDRTIAAINIQYNTELGKPRSLRRVSFKTVAKKALTSQKKKEQA